MLRSSLGSPPRSFLPSASMSGVLGPKIEPVASRAVPSAAGVSATGASATGVLARDVLACSESVEAVVSAGLKISVSLVDVVSQPASQNRQDAAAKPRVTQAFIG